MTRVNIFAVMMVILTALFLCCSKEEASGEKNENNIPIEEEALYIDLENISFKSISEILLEAIKAYDTDARMARIDITINIESNLKDLKAIMFNDDTQTRYVCNIEENKLIVKENPALFQAPMISMEDIIIDYEELMSKIPADIEDESVRNTVKDFALARIVFFNRQDRPTYMTKYVNKSNQNQSIVLYFDSKNGELYHIEKLGF